MLVGLAAPAELAVEWVDGITDGLRDEAALCGATVVGGDVVRSDLLTVAVTALGGLEGRAPVTRSGARVGDIVGVAGRLGWAAAGLRLLSGARTAPAGRAAASGAALRPRSGACPPRRDLDG